MVAGQGTAIEPEFYEKCLTIFPPFISPQKLNLIFFAPTLLKRGLLTPFSFHTMLKHDGHMTIMTSLRCHFCTKNIFLRNFTRSGFLFI